MITINGKNNQNSDLTNTEFTEASTAKPENNSPSTSGGVISTIFTNLNKRTEESLDNLDHLAEPIGTELKPAETYIDGLATATSKLDKSISSALNSGRSIIARAKNSVLQFPVYITNTVNISVAHIVAKTFERVYASFVQSALSQYPIVDENSINDLAFLKQFHTNLKESANPNCVFNEYYQPIDDFDQIMQESIHNTIICDSGVSITFESVPSDNNYLNAENARLLNEPLSGFENFFTEENNSENAEAKKKKDEEEIKKMRNEYRNTVLKGLRERENRPRDTNGMSAGNAQRKDSETSVIDKTIISDDKFAKNVLGINTPKLPTEPDGPETKYPAKPVQHSKETDVDFQKRTIEWQDKIADIDNEYENDMKKYKTAVDKYATDKKEYDEKIKKLKDDIANNNVTKIVDGNVVHYDKNNNLFYTQKVNVKSRMDNVELKAPQMLKDSEIKKINGMLPYTFDASFMLRSANGAYSGNIVHYIIGVKTVLHVINPKDLSDDLRDLITGGLKNLQKVRYKTGEISFWKDYVFRKNALKADAAKNLNGNKRWINTLKRLSDFNKQHGSLFDKPASSLAGGNTSIPNETLVLTQPDVLMLKSETGIDLENIGMAKTLARNLFMIGIVIIDSSAGTMKVLFPDSDNRWDIQSLDSIMSEIGKTDNSNLLKELRGLVSK